MVLRMNSISLRFRRLVGMVVMDLRMVMVLASKAQTVARILASKAQMVDQVPAAMAARTLARKARKAQMMDQVQVLAVAVTEVVHQVDLDLGNKVRLANHLEAHLVAQVLAKEVHQGTQDLATAGVRLVPPAMVNKPQMAAQVTVAMESLRAAVRLLANKALKVVQDPFHLATLALALALALALTVVPTRVPMAMVRTWTPETTLAHRTKGKVAL